MKKRIYKETIKSNPEKIWKILWEDESYRKWTSAFHAGSYAESEWKEGSKIRFLGPDGSGMYSKIEKLVEPTYMSFKHLGIVKEGKDLPPDEESKKWSGAMEIISLKEMVMKHS